MIYVLNLYGKGFYGGYGFSPFHGFFGASLSFLLIFLLVWSIFWKGWALWKAVKNDSKIWFIVLLVLNTVGILEILYIFIFGKKKTTSGKK